MCCNANLDVVLDGGIADLPIFQLAGQSVAVSRHSSQLCSEPVNGHLQLQLTASERLCTGRQLGNGVAQLSAVGYQLRVFRGELFQLSTDFDVVALLCHQLQHVSIRKLWSHKLLNIKHTHINTPRTLGAILAEKSVDTRHCL